MVISKNSTFKFEWEDMQEPMMIGISPFKSFAQDIAYELLHENMTEDHSMSYCLKCYQNGTTFHD
ncbi:MAG: hypothetical protein AAFO07_23995 [Bacteroidota bacterium]